MHDYRKRVFNQMKQILDFGCGNQKRPGAIGIDINPKTDADIIHDLNSFPYPFADSIFDEIYADNVIEHLDNVIKVMEELSRITKPNGLVKIIVPYFRAKWAFIDPTHKHFFTTESFAYFQPGHIINQRYRYSDAKFSVDKIIFNEQIKRNWAFSILKYIANAAPVRYENYLSPIFPMDDLTFYLRVVK